MIHLDKIKFIVPISFVEMSRNTYSCKEPYFLKVEKKEVEQVVVIEVSAKILLDNYHNLINVDNIRDVLTAINDVGFCRLDIERTILYAKVVKCDVTINKRLCDIEGVSDLNNLKSLIRLSVNNFQRWQVKEYRGRGNGVVVENATSSPKYHRRITFYDKWHELGLNKNRVFLRACRNGDLLREYFRNRIRVEVNLYSVSQIKRYFEIDNTNLINVLNADINPIQNVMREIFQPLRFTERRITLRDNDRINTLKQHDWDLQAVEADVREHSNNRNVTANMQHYRELYAMHHNFSEPIDICDLMG